MVEKFISQYKNSLRYSGKDWYIISNGQWVKDTRKQRYNIVMDYFVANSGRICTPCKLSQVKKLLAQVKSGLTGSVQ